MSNDDNNPKGWSEDTRKTLVELACLGNGNRYGNSVGNQIALRALGLDPATVYNQVAE